MRMRMRIAAVLPAFLLTMLGAQADAHARAPLITVVSGKLAGARNGRVVSFKGVPYAAPPVAALRWKPPQPVAAWKGVRSADTYGAICEQKYSAVDNGVGALPMSEDCLTLNIFAPAEARDAPVMFWIHGGGFVNGSGTAALYDGSALARQGVVVVTINYRLGRFGFFAHPALTAEAGGQPVGNYAIMDMIAALKWVHANIRKVGGDPGQVTIFGESAGGVAVNDLMVSPAARGLFVRAIVESGLGRERTLPLAEAEGAGVAFAKSLGLASPTAGDLRKLTAEQILAAGDPDLFSGGTAMVDGKILTTGPLQGFEAAREASVPYIVGWNSLEFPAPANTLTARPAPGSPFSADALKRIAAAYPDKDAYDRYLVSDAVFVEPAAFLAKLHAAHGFPTRVYQFSVLPKAAPPLLKGAPHAFERQYVFQTLKTSPFPTDGNDAVQASTMSAYWAAFAKSGDPNGGRRPNWPLFTGSDGRILEFTNDGPQAIAVPREAALGALSVTYR